MNTDRFAQRRNKVRRALKKQGIAGLLVSSFPNVTYLTGFTGDDSHLLIYPGGEILVTDSRYTTQLAEQCPGLDLYVRRSDQSMAEAAAKLIRRMKLGQVGIEADSMTVGHRDRLAADLPRTELVSTAGVVENLRMIKDREEIEQIRRAVRVAEKAFAVVWASLRPEDTEKAIAARLEHQMRLFGAEASSFRPIVAVGPRAALPHASPGEETVGSSNLLLIDWGAELGCYKSDLTRVLLTDRISPKLERIYRVVFRAQLKAIAAIRPGITVGQVDRTARAYIEKAGFGRKFGHGLGHGIGLEVHEAPRLGPNRTLVLQPGMVVTIEPGIYLPGFGGVRIEDDVLVTRSGHEVLSTVPKQIDEVVVR